MSGSLRSPVAPTLPTLRILWGAFFLAPIAYLLVAQVVVGQRESLGQEAPLVGDMSRPFVRTVFALVAVFVLLIQQVLHALVLAPRIGAVESEADRTQALMVSMIIRAALIEVPAILGLVLAILFGQVVDSLLFSIASFALMPLCFPRSSQIGPPTPTFPRHGHS